MKKQEVPYNLRLSIATRMSALRFHVSAAATGVLFSMIAVVSVIVPLFHSVSRTGFFVNASLIFLYCWVLGDYSVSTRAGLGPLRRKPEYLFIRISIISMLVIAKYLFFSPHQAAYFYLVLPALLSIYSVYLSRKLLKDPWMGNASGLTSYLMKVYRIKKDTISYLAQYPLPVEFYLFRQEFAKIRPLITGWQAVILMAIPTAIAGFFHWLEGVTRLGAQMGMIAVSILLVLYSISQLKTIIVAGKPQN